MNRVVPCGRTDMSKLTVCESVSLSLSLSLSLSVCDLVPGRKMFFWFSLIIAVRVLYRKLLSEHDLK